MCPKDALWLSTPRRRVLRRPNQPSSPARKVRPRTTGFVVLDDVSVDGFTLGKITDFEVEPCMEGDAFVIAPDGSRAGLVWEVCDPPYFRESCPSKRAGGECGASVSACQ